MVQIWHDLLFAHWPVPVAEVRRLVPPPLVLDTYEGQAWVGIVPFRMSGIRHRRLFPLPLLSASLELNVRTYVRLEDRPGVFFFSLDAANLAAVLLARRWYHLPYFHAEMSLKYVGEMIHYRSRRIHSGAPPAAFQARYLPAGDVFPSAPGALNHWLTERYCLYSSDARGRVFRGEIHHAPWPFEPAEAEIELNTMTLPLGIALAGPPLLHFARRLEVAVWSPERVK